MRKRIIVIVVFTLALCGVVLGGLYLNEKVVRVEIPLYRNIFIGDGYDLLNDKEVVLPYEILLYKFVPDTSINMEKEIYSEIVVRDKRSQAFEVLPLMPYVDAEYDNYIIRLMKYNYSQEANKLYFLIEVEQRRYQQIFNNKY